jgi:AraC family transcriptional regulator, positive regulator of tynA and feaB
LLGNGPTSQASAGPANTNLSRYIDANLRDPKLTPSAVAEAAGVSLRTLQRAFESSDLSVAEIIRTRRLAVARDDILAGASIASVARRWQFSDPSHFSRSFKRHFGVAPGGIREVR